MASEPRSSRLSDEDRSLIRRIGGQLGQLIQGMSTDLPDLQRRDELGILANMVNRLARELTQARERDGARQAELERRLAELQGAYEVQEKLLGRVRELSYPVLTLHPDVLLVPIAGDLALDRFAEIVPPLLLRLAATRARAVILDISCVAIFDADAARLLIKIERATRVRGVILVAAGVPIGADEATGIDLSPLTPCIDLTQALTTALDLVGYRIIR